MLVKFTKRLQKAIRKSDLVSRLAGDEFTILIETVSRTEDIKQIVEKLLRQCAGVYKLAGNEVMITQSVGISIYPKDGTEAKVLLRQADASMYQAKKQGKNGYCFFDESVS